MRRCARSTNTINATIPAMKTRTRISVRIERFPCRICWKRPETAEGRRTTIPAKMISEIPLPIPRSVICSPTNMMKIVPVVSVSNVMRRKPQPDHREPPQRTSRKDVEETERAAGRGSEELVESRRIDAGRRDQGSQTVDGEHEKREQDPLAQVGHVEDVDEALKGAQRGITSQRPPAASIFD